MLGITHFLHANDIGVEFSEIAMDCANLPILFGARCVGPSARKPLDVPKCGGDCDSRTNKGSRRGGGWSCLGAESAGEESYRKESDEKSGEHGGRIASKIR